MRTLKEIDMAIFKRVKAQAEMGSPVLTPQEAVSFYSDMEFGDKYREMYAILKALEEFLNKTFEGWSAGCDENDAKANLKKLLDKL
jgi:hypothetical protein